VCASAGLVVSAGFVFNKVFVYWFPNFAFAFALPGLVAVIALPVGFDMGLYAGAK
jgi:hypothetical protein